MKYTRSQNTKQSKQGVTHKPKPEIRDDLDSRENKEGNFRNEDSDKSRKLKKKKENR